MVTDKKGRGEAQPNGGELGFASGLLGWGQAKTPDCAHLRSCCVRYLIRLCERHPTSTAEGGCGVLLLVLSRKY